MSDNDTFLSSIRSETPNSEILLSAFDLFDRSMAIFDKDGVLLGLNNQALLTYGIKDKEAFLNTKPNFFDSSSFKSSFNPAQLATKDIVTKIFFNYDKFNEDFPGIGFKKGRDLHNLRIHPIFDKNGTIQFMIVFSTDLSVLKKDTVARDKLKDALPTMMNAQGITTWIYDIESGRRILNEGPHLFPECTSMDDFVNLVDKVDARVLKNKIHLIQYEHKNDSSLVIRIKDTNSEDGFIYLDVYCVPQYEDEEVRGIFIMTKDVTLFEKTQRELIVKDKRISSDKTRLHKSNILLHSLINRMPCMFFAKNVDNDFRYEMANSLFCELVGKDITKIIGCMDNEVLHSGFDLAEIHRGDIIALTKGFYEYTHTSTTNGKVTKWSSLKYLVETPDKTRLVICLSRDVTEVYAAKDEAKEAQTEALRAEKMKNAFMHNISNELVNPLNAVIGFSQLLMDTSSTDEEKAQYEREINHNGRLLKDIMDEISELSKIDAGLVVSKKESFDICKYLAEIKSQYESHIHPGVEFRLKLPCKSCIVSIDKFHLAKIIHRALINAIGYAFNGYIELGLECQEYGIKLYIEDTGIGLTDDEIATVKGNSESINGFRESIAFTYSLCNIYAKIIDATIDFSSAKGGVSNVWIFVPTTLAIY